MKKYEAAWNYMYQEWLFKGKEKPRDAVPFELYVIEPPKRLKDKSFTYFISQLNNREVYTI